MKNQRTKNQDIPSLSHQPWPWYKVWTNTLFHPNVETGKALLSEGNISFTQAISWLIVTSSVVQLISSAIVLVKNPSLITLSSAFGVVINSLLAGVLSPIGVVVLTGGIHALAKLFNGRGTWQNFFIVWVAFNAPILMLFYLFAFVYQVLGIKDLLIFGPVISFYWLLVVNPVAIKSTYGLRWIGSCLINFFAVAVLFGCFASVITTLYHGILRR